MVMNQVSKLRGPMPNENFKLQDAEPDIQRWASHYLLTSSPFCYSLRIGTNIHLTTNGARIVAVPPMLMLAIEVPAYCSAHKQGEATRSPHPNSREPSRPLR